MSSLTNPYTDHSQIMCSLMTIVIIELFFKQNVVFSCLVYSVGESWCYWNISFNNCNSKL